MVHRCGVASRFLSCNAGCFCLQLQNCIVDIWAHHMANRFHNNIRILGRGRSNHWALFFGVVGVVPIAMLAAFLKGEWDLSIAFAVAVLFTFFAWLIARGLQRAETSPRTIGSEL